MGPKYVIGALPPQIPQALAARLAKVELATVGHFRDRGFVHRSIAPVKAPVGTLVGTAFTIAIPADDSTLLQHAIAQLRPGDFLMIDRLGDERHACLGGGVAFGVKRRGAVGAVIDGPCTDPHEIIEHDLPVWCRGVSSVTTRIRDNGGALNKPISCGNVPVLPGDVVLADATGVLVIPLDEVEAVCEEALMRQDRMAAMMQQFAAGGAVPKSRASTLVEAAIDGENHG